MGVCVCVCVCVCGRAALQELLSRLAALELEWQACVVSLRAAIKHRRLALELVLGRRCHRRPPGTATP